MASVLATTGRSTVETVRCRLRLIAAILVVAGVIVGLTVGLTSRPASAEGTVMGKLVLAGGPPSASEKGVRGSVTLVDLGSGATFRAVASANGSFSIAVPAGTYRARGQSPLAHFDGHEIVGRVGALLHVGRGTTQVEVSIFIE